MMRKSEYLEIEVTYPEYDGSQNCAGVPWEVMFNSEDVDNARKVCNGCTFFDACREWGLWREESGVWGGLSQKQRASWRMSKGIRAEWLQWRNSLEIDSVLQVSGLVQNDTIV